MSLLLQRPILVLWLAETLSSSATAFTLVLAWTAWQTLDRVGDGATTVELAETGELALVA